jgi:methylenetetrahydrofolate reductase (NADPH)
MKIIDKIKKAQEEKRILFSFEYFPPKTPEGVKNLYERMDRMGQLEPAWIDVTWGAGGSTSELTLDICKTAQNLCGLETMMHLTCTNLPVVKVYEALKKAKEAGMQNILALRGDPPAGQEWKQIEGGFAHAVDLVKYIRQEYGNYFGICVAGYPEAHIESTSYEDDLKHIKAKVDAGADFIITQLFYDVDLFIKWVADCRALGITCPILPGLMPIQTYAGFQRMTTLCKTKVPEFIKQALEPIKDNDEAVKAYGVELAVQMSRRLLEAGVPALHFYTLNLERSALQILSQLGLTESLQLRRPLPWRPSCAPTRQKEDVRPIFWNNRPKSYLARTASWDEFPNGRWGDSRSPAFGDLTDYHLFALHSGTSPADRRQIWGQAPTTEQELFQTFARYLKGEIPRLPWNETPLAMETGPLVQRLVRLNQAGFLTINSQPRVNAAPSDHPVHGWGGPLGYVFQKAYLEFFASPERLLPLLERIRRNPSISYMAINVKGEGYGNFQGTNAVTWAVLPGREIIQPTVVDSNAFLVWREEAFALLRTHWLELYEEGSASRALLQKVHDTYFLVSLVDNDFVNGDIWAPFDELHADEAKGAHAPASAPSAPHQEAKACQC